MRRLLKMDWAGWPLLALMLALGLFAQPPLWAAPQASDEVITAVEESFRVLPLEDGWLLEPNDGDLGIRSIEVKAGTTVMANRKDALIARITLMAIEPTNSPGGPGNRAICVKASVVVKVDSPGVEKRSA